MKISDPFGRMERRHQAGYEAMRDILRRGCVNTVESAEEIINQSRVRAIKTVGIGCVFFLLVGLLFPKFALGACAVAVLLAAWVISSTINGRRYIKRYIKEDLE